jgi:alkylation response protein AidB-like acyl-CoA dehydrogenase
MSDAEVRDELRAVAREMLAAGVDWKAIADAGWLGLEIADELGGSGATFAEVAVVLQEMGRAAAAVPYLGTAVLGAFALDLLDVPAELSGEVASGQIRLAVVLPSGDSRSLGFQLNRVATGLELGGSEDVVADASSADRLLVVTFDPGGRPVIVAATPGEPGLRLAERPMVDATREFGSVAAERMPVKPDAVWTFRGEPQAAVDALLDRAALAIACDCLGVAEAMLDATVAYAGVRHQFGRAIGSFQAVKHACADMLVQVTIGRELLAAAVSAVSEHADDAWVAVSMAKSFLGLLAVDVAGNAMQLHGGFGYTWESGVPAYLKRAVLNRSLFGSTAAHRARLASRYVTA